jgi:predicted GNAT superfamily acetyltransferase
LITFRPFETKDTTALLLLNEASVEATSPLDEVRLGKLLEQGCQITVAETNNAVYGFLMVFNEGSEYDSVNYQWFNKKFKSFAYVDRIVIGAAFRGQGAGQQFYQRLKQQASGEGRRWITAEINIQPPNETSLVFHQKQSFVEIGTQSVGSKVVSLQACELD